MSADHDRTPDGSLRESLTRALASESRNALARVELAASELARSGLAPTLADRVSTIRVAVEEIDGMLRKIDLLSDGERVRVRAPVELSSAARGVVERVSAGLGARGVGLEWTGHPSSDPELHVAAPGPTVELLCLGLVRLIAAAIARPAAGDVLRSESPTVRVAALRRRDDVCLVARCARVSPAPRFDRTARLELEVILAEWRGAFLVGDDPDFVEVGFALPAAPAAAPRAAMRGAKA